MLRRGLTALGEALASQLAPGRQTGWLAGYDPRAKILAALFLIVAISLLSRLETLAVAAGGALVLALTAGLRGRKLTPLWLGVPLFTLVLAIPAALSLVTPGRPVVVLWHGVSGHLGPWTLPGTIAITAPGLIVAGRFLLRALAGITVTLTLTGTTEAAGLVNGLRRLGLPRAFGMVLTMMQRYVVVLLRKAEDLHLARLSRTVNAETVRQGQRRVAAGLGLLFVSALHMADSVHHAMLARGYDGDVQAFRASRWGWREGRLVVVAGLLAVLLILVDRFL